MKRQLEKSIKHWKNSPNRLPLIIRGARQVGKTYLIESIGKTLFKDSLTVNFEFQPESNACFDTLDPQDIIKKLEITFDKSITEETLLFLDEIQDCPNALIALRYFKEKRPKQPVIAAGSLLEFALEDDTFRMPVGRVKQLHLYPFSFKEFLMALDKPQKLAAIETTSLKNPLDPSIHKQLLKEVRLYCAIGGMPAAIKEYKDTQSLLASESIQNAISQTYRQDFAKYSKSTQTKYVQKVFDEVPQLIGQQIKYSHIAKDYKARDIKAAIHLLINARILSPIYYAPADGLPLGARYKDNIFKLLWTDVALLQNKCGLLQSIVEEANLLSINRGAITEQFVGQEWLANSNPERDPQLYFWKRDKVGSQAEVDYVIAHNGKIYPIEVKSGKTGRLRSLQSFMQHKNAPIGIKISEKALDFNDNILSVPLYMCHEIPRLLDEL